MDRNSAPSGPRSRENIDLAAISSASFCAIASRSVAPAPVAAECFERRAGDVTGQNRDDRIGEGRRHYAPLLPPIGALAKQQAVADDGPEHTHRRRRPVIVLEIVDEHPMDGVGTVEEEERLHEEAAAEDLLLVGGARPEPEHVAAQGAQGAKRRQHPLGRGRSRRNERRSRGCLRLVGTAPARSRVFRLRNALGLRRSQVRRPHFGKGSSIRTRR